MNWFKQAEIQSMDSFIYNTYQAIQGLMGGNWNVKVVTDDKESKIYWLQRMLTFKLEGKGVIQPTDYFYSYVRVWVKRSAGKTVHPYDGSYENSSKWDDVQLGKIEGDIQTQGEELKKRWNALYNMKPDDASQYDSEYGNRLFEIRVVVGGYSCSYKDDKEIGASNDLDTPKEIANFIKNSIMKHYFGEGGQDDFTEPIDPTDGDYEEPEFTYDPPEPVYAPNVASSKNWFKRSQYDEDEQIDPTIVGDVSRYYVQPEEEKKRTLIGGILTTTLCGNIMTIMTLLSRNKRLLLIDQSREIDSLGP